MRAMRAMRLVLAMAALALPAALGAQGGSLVVQARAAGQVGERYDGYLGFVSTASRPLWSQVSAVNIKRRALYTDLASRRGVAAQEVGISAGCALLGRVAVGEAYQLGDGVWRRRAAGQAAPRPDYCG